MWSSAHGAAVYPGQGTYNHVGYHQTYERLQQGEPPQHAVDPRSLQHATQSFTSRYYDETFPKPVGALQTQRIAADQGSFQSVALQSNAGSFVSTTGLGGGAIERPAGDHLGAASGGGGAPAKSTRANRVPLADYLQFCRDHSSRLLVWAGALLAAVVAALLLANVFASMSSRAFIVFSTLAWESWFPSFWAIMLVLACGGAAALAAAALAAVAGSKETKPLLRSFFISSAILGVILIVLASFSWLYGLRAKPYVVRAANLMCQETDVWGCQAPPAAGAPPRTARRLAPELANASEEGLSRGHPAATVPGLREALAAEEALPLGAPAAPRRRLTGSLAKVVVNFRNRLDVEGQNGGICSMVAELCKAPPGFDAATACVCSGQWDYAPAAPAPAAAPPAPAAAADRRLRNATAGPGIDGSADGAAVAAPVRQLQTGDPWQGSIGDYCSPWASTSPSLDARGDWCFVPPTQICEKKDQAVYKTTRDILFVRSRGPCSDAVDSRSQMIHAGLESLFLVAELAGVLGCVLVACSCCGVLLYQRPSKVTVWHDSGKSRVPEYKGQLEEAPQELAFKPSMEDISEQRFEEAQRQAVVKLSAQTPEDVKLMLYGFYKQAKEGDVRGERPTFWNSKERAKHDFWARHQGMSRQQAIEGYVRTVAMLS